MQNKVPRLNKSICATQGAMVPCLCTYNSEIKVSGGRLCHFLDQIIMRYSSGDFHTLVIVTKMCLLNMIFFLKNH
jgi:hypothetical protein